MAHGAPWDRAEEDVLTAAWLAGDTPKDIAKALGRTRAAVRFRRQKLGLPARDRGAGVPRVGADLVAEGTRVQLLLPDALLPPKGRRPAVIREALALRQRMAPHEGPPPTDRVVLVYEVGVNDAAFCVPSTLGWHLRWRKRHADCYDTTAEAEANGQEVAPGWLSPNQWPSRGYRWRELPGGS